VKGYNLHISEKARLDIVNIQTYTAQSWGAEAARKYAKVLHKAFDTVLENPDIGFRREYMPTNVRMKMAGRHFIMYKAEENFIHVLRVLHHAMDITDSFGEEE
jgi:toxin ParE1/3/4